MKIIVNLNCYNFYVGNKNKLKNYICELIVKHTLTVILLEH